MEFFLSRLNDHASVAYSLDGVLSLLEMKIVSKTDQLSIPTRIFSELNVQTFPQSVRNTIFRIFKEIFDQNINGLKKIEKDFIIGFIHTMDGEKDPRNLLLLFEISKLIVLHLNFEKNYQDLFEVLFCYFPITFRPPPNDPYGVTSEQLKIALRNVISSTPLFSTLAIPILLEKLTSASNSAKKDSMDTITACLPVYGINSFVPHISELWNCLKKEMASAADEDMERSALNCITQLTKEMASAVTVTNERNSKSSLEKLLDTIVNDCMDNLVDPELQYARPCGKILQACAISSMAACDIVLKQVHPLLEQFSKEEVSSKKKILLKIIVDLVVASRIVKELNRKVTKEDSDVVVKTPISPYKDTCIEVFISVLMTSKYAPLKTTAVEGMYELIISSGLLNRDETELLMNHFNSLILAAEIDESYEKALACLSKIADLKPKLLLDTSTPLFLKSIDVSASKESFDAALVALKTVSVTNELFLTIFPLIIEKLSFNVFDKPLLLQKIEEIASAREIVEKDSKMDKLIASQVDSIWKILQNEAIFTWIIESFQNLKSFGHILSIITRSLNSSEQETLLKNVISFNKGKSNSNNFIPQTKELMYIFKCVICNLQPTTSLVVEDEVLFMNELLKVGLENGDDISVIATAQSVSSILNKTRKETIIKAFVSNFKDTILNDSKYSKTNTLIVFSWICKALVLRMHPLGWEFTTYLIDLLKDNQMGLIASDGIEIVIKLDEEGILTKDTFAIQKALFKQKFYNQCLPQILTGFETCSQDTKKNYLLALSHLLCNVNNKTLLNELPKLFPMLLQSLNYQDSRLKVATLTTLTLMVNESPRLISDHIDTIVTKLLELSSYQTLSLGNNSHVRSEALHLLGLLSEKIEFSIVFPLKVKIVNTLGDYLDDPKRIVRQKASNTRGKWYLLTGPPEKL
ncbi:Dos2-interacting transcription regulator of RNA-Pol-II-domain-containing protein [Globomyces pollinis-pini]|nr:Dos2-interacting transcription regulator of RNA-Pol-II-domain-containing protein [Globomyces pollinis-pini]